MIKHTLKLNMNLMYYDCFDWTISGFNKIYIHKKNCNSGNDSKRKYC